MSIYADNEISGIEHFQSHLWELIDDTKYELDGPTAVYCREDWADMDEEDRQRELDNWDEPTEKRSAELQIRLDTLNEVWALADKACCSLYKRAEASRREYNRGKYERDMAYMSHKESTWRKMHKKCGY